MEIFSEFLYLSDGGRFFSEIAHGDIFSDFSISRVRIFFFRNSPWGFFFSSNFYISRVRFFFFFFFQKFSMGIFFSEFLYLSGEDFFLSEIPHGDFFPNFSISRVWIFCQKFPMGIFFRISLSLGWAFAESVIFARQNEIDTFSSACSAQTARTIYKSFGEFNKYIKLVKEKI